jgi:hypothetical protein
MIFTIRTSKIKAAPVPYAIFMEIPSLARI